MKKSVALILATLTAASVMSSAALAFAPFNQEDSVAFHGVSFTGNQGSIRLTFEELAMEFKSDDVDTIGGTVYLSELYGIGAADAKDSIRAVVTNGGAHANVTAKFANNLISSETGAEGPGVIIEITSLTPNSVEDVQIRFNLEYTKWDDVAKKSYKFATDTQTFTYTPNPVDIDSVEVDANGKVTHTYLDNKAITEAVISAIMNGTLKYKTGFNTVTTAYDILVTIPTVKNLSPIVLKASIADGVDGDAVLKDIKFDAAGQTVADNAKVTVDTYYDLKNVYGTTGYYVYFIEAAGAKDSVKGMSDAGIKATLVSKDLVMTNDGKITFDLLNNKLGRYVITKTELVNVPAPTTTTTTTTKPNVPNPETGSNVAIGAAMALGALSLAAAGAIALKKVK